MGVQLKDILKYSEITIEKLSQKKVAIDSFNMLYQFLASIRQADGSLLTDSKGRTTSHLKGLFNRLIYFKVYNVFVVFVFDGKAPILKEKIQKIRYEKKMDADTKYREALELGLTSEAKKFAQGTIKLESEMIEEAKKLIELFGFPTITAPSEGESQCSYFTNTSKVFACVSQDFDSLLFKAKNLIRNLSIQSRRKIPGTNIYKDTSIEFYNLEENLKHLNINQEQLIVIAILCGTDFNPGGIKGIGPKKALKLVKEYIDKYDKLFEILDWHSFFTYTWHEVYNTIAKIEVKDFEFEFKEIQKKEIVEYLKGFDFDCDLLEKSLKKIKGGKTLDRFF